MGSTTAGADLAHGESLTVRVGPVRRSGPPGRNGRSRRPVPPPLPARVSQPAGRTAGFPRLEPPVPLASRVSGKSRRRGILSELWWQTPCWLASLVVHLAVLITFASIVMTYGDRPGLMRIILTMGTARDQMDTPLETATVLSFEHRSDQQRVAERPALAKQGDDEHEKDHKDVPPLMLRSLMPSEAPPADAEHSPPGRGAVAGPIDPRTRNPQTSDASERATHDRVVDRFILYDIGELRGEEGQQARRDFERLGPRAIPSLVYGLNQAANLRANCPISVISRKLDEALAANNDPAMLQYAIENIGRDVPKGAPYAARIAGIRRRLAKSDEARFGRVRAEIAALGLDPAHSRLARDACQLTRATVGDLVTVLGDDDPDRRLAAAVAASVKSLPAEQPRARLVTPLVRLLDDPDPQIRGQARRALVAITHEDFGPEDVHASEEDRQAAMDQWLAHWQDRAGMKMLEPQAAAALARAEALQVRGRKEAATKHYRGLISSFPDSQAAEEARRRLQLTGGTQ